MTNLKFIIEKIISNNPKIKDKIREQKIKSNWKLIYKNIFDDKIKRFVINNDILEITLNSSSLRNDLFLMKEKLLKELNKGLTKDYIIKDIMFF